jgi:putative nucleotidyltransferase with HDIG domain
MDKQSVLTEIQQRGDLLSMPQALAEILREVDNPDFGSEHLARIILKDPPMTARVLRLANSTMYRRGAEVSNVHQAVQALGAVTVKCLALSSSVLNPDKVKKASGVDPKAYFAQLMMVAAASERLAQQVSSRHGEEAFIAGLLHDIGTLIFMHHYPERYRRILEGQVRGAVDIIEAERAVFGTDHCEVGYHLASRWQLPGFVREAIKSHHGPLEDNLDNPIPTIVHLATLMADQASAGHTMDLETRLPAIKNAADVLGLSREEVDGVSVSLMSAAVATAKYLELDIGDTEAILSRANREIWGAYLMVENLFRERQELTRKLLEQERAKGAYESKTIAMATLSHYLNNAAMAVYGRSQMLRMRLDKGETDTALKMLPASLDVIDWAVKKVVAVLAEMKEISPVDEIDFLSTSKAMNMDERIQRRMEAQEKMSPLVLPEEAEILP